MKKSISNKLKIYTVGKIHWKKPVMWPDQPYNIKQIGHIWRLIFFRLRRNKFYLSILEISKYEVKHLRWRFGRVFWWSDK